MNRSWHQDARTDSDSTKTGSEERHVVLPAPLRFLLRAVTIGATYYLVLKLLGAKIDLLGLLEALEQAMNHPTDSATTIAAVVLLIVVLCVIIPPFLYVLAIGLYVLVVVPIAVANLIESVVVALLSPGRKGER